MTTCYERANTHLLSQSVGQLVVIVRQSKLERLSESFSILLVLMLMFSLSPVHHSWDWSNIRYHANSASQYRIFFRSQVSEARLEAEGKGEVYFVTTVARIATRYWSHPILLNSNHPDGELLSLSNKSNKKQQLIASSLMMLDLSWSTNEPQNEWSLTETLLLLLLSLYDSSYTYCDWEATSK